MAFKNASKANFPEVFSAEEASFSPTKHRTASMAKAAISS